MMLAERNLNFGNVDWKEAHRGDGVVLHQSDLVQSCGPAGDFLPE